MVFLIPIIYLDRKGIIWMPMASSSSACWRPGLGKLGFISVIWPAGFYRLQRARIPLTSLRWYGLATCSPALPSFFQITSTTRAGNHTKERIACFMSNNTGNSNFLFAQSDLLNVNVCHLKAVLCLDPQLVPSDSHT